MKNISRRRFLGQASCAGLGTLSFANTLLNLKAVNAAAISNSAVGSSSFKGLVVLFKLGGNDSFNTIIPRDTANFNEYYNSRGAIALESTQLLPINLSSPDPDGRLYGLHPELDNLQTLFNMQKAAFIANVGTLVRPTSLVDYTANNYLPLGLYSHSDQQEQWQTSIPDKRALIGWGGRVADLINDQNSAENLSMCVSLAGRNIFQTGNTTIEYAINNSSGSTGITGYNFNSSSLYDISRSTAVKSMVEQTYADMFKQTYVDVVRSSRDAHADFQSAISNAATFTQFTNSNLGRTLEMIAKVMSVRQEMGFVRQIFYVGIGGWDTHQNQAGAHDDLLQNVDNDLKNFQDALEQIGLQDCVLTAQMSEFGRTISSNASGTDHAWGGNVYVMGGQNLIHGGLVHGQFPSLDLTSANAINAEPRGRLIPQISTDAYFGEIARWFGVAAVDLPYVFPNIGQFYSYLSDKHPVGFLKPYTN